MATGPAWVYVLVAFVVYVGALVYFFLPSPYLEGSKFARKNQSVAVLVLGDIGRSPRVQYHASSLSKLGYTVQVIGYKGTEPHRALLEDSNIKYQTIPDVPEALLHKPRYLFPIFGPLKVLHQIFFLFIILGYAIDPPAYILVQNPPSIPSLLLVQLICKIRKSRLVIDWHNTGFSVLAIKLGAGHPFVIISKLYEQLFGKNAFAHFTVSETMKQWLVKNFGLNGQIQVLHDRPPAQFEKISQKERTAFLQSSEDTKDFDVKKDKLIISSTSWTPDEDFSILLDALQDYDANTEISSSQKPRILAIITGKGPLKEHYLREIQKLKLSKVTIKCAWLTAEEYPTILACADLGICLHTSSSGLDLPMKVVDMFGCGVPVLATQFDAIHELVTNGLNGRIFNDSEDLTQCLLGLFANGEDGQAHLEQLREGAEQEGKKRWDETWNTIAAPIFKKR